MRLTSVNEEPLSLSSIKQACTHIWACDRQMRILAEWEVGPDSFEEIEGRILVRRLGDTPILRNGYCSLLVLARVSMANLREYHLLCITTVTPWMTMVMGRDACVEPWFIDLEAIDAQLQTLQGHGSRDPEIP